MSVPTRAASPSDRRAMLTGFLLTAVFDVGLALAAFAVARRLGADARIAYLISGIGPLTMAIITWVRARTLSGASAVILLFLVLSSVATFVGGTDPRLLIAKDSVVTGGFGAVCLVSLLAPRPLMFYFGAKFATDGTREGLQYWSGLWRYPDFRRSQNKITIAWGVGFLIEAALRIVAAYTIHDFNQANTIATLLPFVFLAVLITYTIRTGMRARAAGLARARAAVEDGPPPQPALGTAPRERGTGSRERASPTAARGIPPAIHGCRWSPDGRTLWASPSSTDPGRTDAIDLSTGKVAVVAWYMCATAHPASGVVSTLMLNQGASHALLARVDQAAPADLHLQRRALILDNDSYLPTVFSPDGRYFAIRGNAYRETLNVFAFPSFEQVLYDDLGDIEGGDWSRHDIVFGAKPGTCGSVPPRGTAALRPHP